MNSFVNSKLLCVLLINVTKKLKFVNNKLLIILIKVYVLFKFNGSLRLNIYRNSLYSLSAVFAS